MNGRTKAWYSKSSEEFGRIAIWIAVLDAGEAGEAVEAGEDEKEIIFHGSECGIYKYIHLFWSPTWLVSAASRATCEAKAEHTQHQ